MKNDYRGNYLHVFKKKKEECSTLLVKIIGDTYEGVHLLAKLKKLFHLIYISGFSQVSPEILCII